MSAKGFVCLGLLVSFLSCVAAQGPSLLSGLLATVAAGGEGGEKLCRSGWARLY